MQLARKFFLGKLNAVNEFEREPIPQSKLQGLKSFLGMYAGEHTAGTEFVIGPLFVAHGVAAGGGPPVTGRPKTTRPG